MKKKEVEREFYTTTEMSQLLGVSKIALLNWYKEGEKDLPPVIKNAGKFLYPISGYEKWKERKERGSIGEIRARIKEEKR